MTYTIIDRMRFQNRENEKIESQKSVDEIRRERDKIYEDFSHIKSVDMTKEYEKVHNDNRTHHNSMYLVPPHRYRNKK